MKRHESAGAGNIPLLLVFYFGEAAGRAQQGASRRLVRWSRAFDEWLAERKRNDGADTIKQSVLAWRRRGGWGDGKQAQAHGFFAWDGRGLRCWAAGSRCWPRA